MISLEGIIPTQTQEYTSNATSILKTTKKINLDTITNTQRGVFVVDVTGNGVACRAVIKKGGLSCMQEMTIAGHLITILTDEMEVCRDN